MKLFAREQTPTPVEAGEQDVGKASQRCDRLSAELQVAESELAASKAAASEAALNGNSNGLTDLAEQIATREAATSALRVALNTADAKLQRAQASLDHERDVEQRAQSIATLRALIGEIEACSHPLTTAVADLVKVLQRAAPITYDCRNVAGFFEVVAGDLPLMVSNAQQALEYHIHQISSGVARATLPAAEITPVAISTQTPPDTVSVCLLYDGRWRDPASGLERHAAKGWDVGLVPEIAARVIAAGVAVPSDSGQAKILRRERASPVPNPDAIDLDDPAVAPPSPPAERTINVSRAIWQPPGNAGPPSWFGKPT
jgi:hypothetical protein